MNGTTHSIRLISSSVILLLAISAHAATVWNGPTISFTKENYANPLLATNQDRLTANVWITRGSSQGLFNANTESRFTHFVSPAGTEWANGSLENYATLSYTNWNHWAAGVNPSPPATVGVQAVLHLIADDIYLSVRFTSWSRGAPGGGPSYGGGFSYLRSTPVPEPTNAVPIVTWQQPANNAAFPPGFAISLRARATDSDGTVSNVDFFVTPTNGPTINVGQGTLASDGYYVRGWTNPPPGQYQLHAEAVDNAGGRGISDSVRIVVVDTSQPPTNAQTRTWTGADPSGYWSAPANWSPAGVLVNGDALVFPGGLPPGDMVSTNDLTDRIFRSITFSGASRNTIRGNPITLTNRTDVIINSGTNVIACDLTFSGTPPTPTAATIRSSFDSFNSGDLTVIGNVGGGSLYIGVGFWRLVIMGQFTGGSLAMDWYVTMALYGDNPYAVSADVWGSTLLVQGSQPNLNIRMSWNMEAQTPAILSGDGLVGDVTALTSSTRITPDSTLSVKNISGGLSTLLIRLNGTNAGEYGRLVASGNVSLNGGSLTPSPGFNPQPGQVFTIVEKTSPGPITGAIFGPEGTITTLNGMPFRISYVGGDGNDVTLTATAQVNYEINGGTAFVSDSPNASGDVVIDSTYLGYPVTFIASRAFAGCTSLTSVTIPNSVTGMGHSVFAGCTSLTSVTIPNSVTSIEVSAFVGCTSLTNMIVGNSVTSIRDSAFAGCTNLASVTIGNSVTTIGARAFYRCTNLTNFTFLGNAPGLYVDIKVGGFTQFYGVGAGARAYYYCGTTGWGTNYAGLPTVMLFAPRIAPGSAGVKPGGFGFTLTCLTNQTVVEASANLVNWQPIWTNTPPGASAEFLDPEWLNHSNRFYRARSD